MKKNDHIDNRTKKTILIFGISSFVGSNLAEFLKRDYKVVGTYHKNPVSIPGVLTLPCDVLSKDKAQLILFAFKPDITIYAVGLSSLSDCAKRKDLADALNTSGLFNVTEFCQRYKSQICYLSSNFVFGGEDKNYIEMDIPDANTTYGKTQASAEFFLQKSSLNYVIFRCCRLYGRSLNPNQQTWFEQVERKVKSREQLTCDGNVKTGFIDVTYLGLILKLAFEKEVRNRLFQISTPNLMSYYEFALEYCKVFGGAPSTVIKGKWPFPILVSQTMSGMSEDMQFKMDIANIEGFLNVKMPTVQESLEYTRSRLNGKGKASEGGINQGDEISFI
jgi:dTDP-4-dehydrorhamnose reductase